MRNRERARYQPSPVVWLQLGQDVEGTGQRRPGDRGGGDVVARRWASWA
jgi:hypothetical protein